MQEIETIYRFLFPILCKKFHRIALDCEEPQDIAQEALIRLWESGLNEQEFNKLIHWTYRTGIRLAIDILRRKRFIAKTFAGTPRKTEESFAIDLDAQTLAADHLLELFEKAPPLELNAVIMNRVHGTAHKEIARVLEISERTVRRLLKRFDERLRPFDSQ